MSVCNYTEPVSPTTCLGDSLATFNANFSALDEELCSLSNILPGPGISILSTTTEQRQNVKTISAKNSFVYTTNFEYKNYVTATDYPLIDGTTVQASTFPYQLSPNPCAAFSTVALSERPPEVTLFWTASGSDNTTVYATNSGSSLQINGPVTSLKLVGNTLYIGGEFTSINNVDCKKFGSINLIGGYCDSTSGYVGSFIEAPFTTINSDLGNYGTINTIEEYGDLLIVGGSFGAKNNTLRGRGVVIKNKTTGVFYPFYVNGTVNCLTIKDEGTDVFLYVGGNFDYINYGFQGASVISGNRIVSNGLAKISLTLINDGFANNSINSDFSFAVTSSLKNFAVINSLVIKNNTLFIGGDFIIKAGPELKCKNLAGLNFDGTVLSTWSPIIEGTVNTLAIDGDYLYCGGDFDSFYTASEFYEVPRSHSPFYNALAFKISTPTLPEILRNWKPNINGPVCAFTFHDSTVGSYVYCYGRFTVANGNNTGYAAAFKKAYKDLSVSTTADSAYWNIKLQSGPSLINNALVRFGDSIIIGGGFNTLNNNNRNYLARVNGVGQSLLNSINLSSVVFDIGASICSAGTTLTTNYTNFVSVTAYPGPYGTINETTFPVISQGFAGYSTGELIKFFVKRKSLTETFRRNIHVLGCKINFN